MTGLSQVTVRNSVPWDERIPVDVEYVEKFNVWLDIKILLKRYRRYLLEKVYIFNQMILKTLRNQKR